MLAQVAPCRVRPLYQRCPSPAFDLLFSTDGIVDVLAMFKPHESMALVGGSEAETGVGVLLRSTFNIVGDAGVEDMSSAGDDVHAA